MQQGTTEIGHQEQLLGKKLHLVEVKIDSVSREIAADTYPVPS